MAKEVAATNPHLVDLANRIGEWLDSLGQSLDLLQQPYTPGDEKHRKEVYRVLESTQDQAFRIGTLLAKELAKLKADKLAELNPIVGVMAAHMASGCKKILAMFPEEANTISGWKKVGKELKSMSDSSAQMAKIMATTGVPDVVIIPTVPLFDRQGQPSKEVKDATKGKKGKDEKKEESTAPAEPADAPVEAAQTDPIELAIPVPIEPEPVAPPME